ncbi:hypothetical protein PG994_001906 [Apiospora phragmitis]|uniref:Uncharacterized protein n=1 Tax=Apiospora phragmitis TaxID=2905665 RepID=A0ABR1WUV2_9PEZI
MVLEPTPRPSADGSRPVSRFQEGSMNDRVSAAPPVQFLGEDQLARFERQFYPPAPASNNSSSSSSSQRRDRPLSAQAQLPSQVLQRLRTTPQEPTQQLHGDDDVPHRQLRHKKSMGFLNRVRDAFGLGRKDREAGAVSKVQQETEKRISLQHAPTHQRPVHHMTKAHSQSNIPQFPPAFTALTTPVPGGAGTDRPSRDEIMASYNELMATGFFQSHAIQSTRQPPPGSRLQREMAGHSMRSQPLPRIDSPDEQLLQSTSPDRPKYSAMPDSPSSTKSPPRQSFNMQRLAPPPLSHQKLEAKAKASRESLRYNLRGRKRSRAEADINQSNAGGLPLSATGGSFGSIWPSANGSSNSGQGIIRRVSKKLRKMPSGAASADSAKATSPSKGDNGRTASQNTEMSIRMRSPSPDSPGMRSNKAPPGTRNERMPTIPPRSGSVAGAGGANRLRKKAHQYSPQARRQAHSNNPSYPPITLDKYRGLPIQMRSSNRPSGPSPNWSLEAVDVDMPPNGESSSSSSSRSSLEGNKGRAITLKDAIGVAEPLCVVPDANRGIPMVPQIPETFLKNGLYGAKGVQMEVAARNENHRMDVDWQFGQAL